MPVTGITTAATIIAAIVIVITNPGRAAPRHDRAKM